MIFIENSLHLRDINLEGLQFREICASQILNKNQSYKILPERFPVFFVVYKIFEKNLKFGWNWQILG